MSMFYVNLIIVFYNVHLNLYLERNINSSPNAHLKFETVAFGN